MFSVFKAIANERNKILFGRNFTFLTSFPIHLKMTHLLLTLFEQLVVEQPAPYRSHLIALPFPSSAAAASMDNRTKWGQWARLLDRFGKGVEFGAWLNGCSTSVVKMWAFAY